MPIDERAVPITRPCPVQLGALLGSTGAPRWFCGHCEKDVHILTNMTEREVRALFASRGGERLCVAYNVREDGKLRLRPEPAFVPARSLRRARWGLGATAAATLALAVCDPLGVSAPRGEAEPPHAVEFLPAIEPPYAGEVEIPLVAGGLPPVDPSAWEPEEPAPPTVPEVVEPARKRVGELAIPDTP